MINFVSLNSIVNDLLFLIRGSKVSLSEPISRVQIENWVHQYRALLLKQDIDKGKMPNPDYIQEIPALSLIKVDRSNNPDVLSEEYVYYTESTIPKPIDLNFKLAFMYIGDIKGNEIQVLTEARTKWQQYKKFTGRNTFAYLKNNHIYIEGDDALSYITIRGIFEVPTEVSLLISELTNVPFNDEDPYPIPFNIVPALKAMILQKELNIISTSPSDNKNDSNSAVENNAESKQ
jgi:hypothetical protein